MQDFLTKLTEEITWYRKANKSEPSCLHCSSRLMFEAFEYYKNDLNLTKVELLIESNIPNGHFILT